MNKANLLALILCSLAAAPLHAQVVVMPIDFDGDLSADDQVPFQESLAGGVSRGAPGDVTSADGDEALTEYVGCRGGDCVMGIGLTIPTTVVVVTEVYAEAEIYDFTIRVYDANTGETVVTQTGDCTFCPVAEATESLGFTAEAALGAVDPMPEPTRGSEPVPEDPLAETETETESETETEAGPAFEPGDIAFNVSVEPAEAAIAVNGAPQGSGRVSLDMAAQEFTITVTAEGFETYTEDVTLRESMVGPIFLRVVMTPDAPAVVVAPEPRRSSSGPGFNTTAVGAPLVGLGVASAVGGIILLSLDGDTTCSDGPPELCRDVWEFTAGGAAMTTIGGLALGTGIGILIAGSRSGGDEEAGSGGLTFAPQRGGGQMLFSTQF